MFNFVELVKIFSWGYALVIYFFGPIIFRSPLAARDLYVSRKCRELLVLVLYNVGLR